jgi:hypothetical protein
MPFRASDVATLLLIAIFAWLGLAVHDTVAELASLGRGVQEAGTAVEGTARDAAGALRDGFGRAAGATEGAPVVGGQVAEALRSAGEAAAGPVEREGTARGQELVQAGREGEQQALETARLLGWLFFLVPTLLLLSRVLPARVRDVRRRRAARRLLTAAPMDPRRAAALASRAAYGLPWEALARHTDDPIGDLIAGRHDRLVAALGAEDAGLGLRLRRRA